MQYRGVKVLTKKDVRRGAYYLISADFNASERVDEFKSDLSTVERGGGIGIVLAHKGRFGGGGNKSLKLEAKKVGAKYFPESFGLKAREFVESLKAGESVVLENVRNNSGEEKGDKKLAEKYFSLVKGKECYFVSADFGKAHRKNSSNYGLIAFFPKAKRFISEGHVEEMKKLDKFGKNDTAVKKNSVVAIGGLKKEKISEGLLKFVEIYDYIIPG